MLRSATIGSESAHAASLTAGEDYLLVRRVVECLTARRGAFDPGRFAGDLGANSEMLDHVLRRWCGLSRVEFSRALTMAHVRAVLADGRAIFEGPVIEERRVHDFGVDIAGTITDARQRRGEGLNIEYGFHASPFGEALVMMTDGGVCGLAFIDEDTGKSRHEALADMKARWAAARYQLATGDTERMAARIFEAGDGQRRVPLVLIGTDFDIGVWQALLRIPMGGLVSYADIALHLGRPAASRAVGTANGRNPISFVVPCHRAVRGDGTLGGYYWGLARKRAMIAWEAGRVSKH